MRSPAWLGLAAAGLLGCGLDETGASGAGSGGSSSDAPLDTLTGDGWGVGGTTGLDASECVAPAECVAGLPPGWTGYFLHEDTRDPCPGGSGAPIDTFEEPDQGKFSCKTCACSAAATCVGPASLDVKNSPDCMQQPNASVALAPGAGCETEPGVCIYFKPGDWVGLVGQQPSNLGCTPAAGGGTVQEKTAPKYAKQSRVCPLLAGPACGDGMCVAPVSAGFHGRCVQAAVPDGQSPPACPVDFAGSVHLVVTDPNAFADTRACTPCGTCSGLPSGASCSTTTTYWGPGAPTCGGGSAAFTINADGVCHTNVVPTDIGTGCYDAALTTVTAKPGTCAPAGGGTPTGSVQPSGVSVLCCES